MVQQEQSVVEEKTPDNRNVLHYLFGNQRQKNPDALALLQTIVKINPSLLLEESEFGIRPLDHILQNYYQRNESLQTTSYFDFIVDTLEENKEDIDKPSQYDGHTYLITAASNNVPRHYITRLLEAGANIDGPDNKGMTPLMHACYMRRVENVRVLLEHGAEKDLQDKDGMTALMTAMAVGNYDIVRLLMEYNVPARTNIVSHNEFTAPNLGSSAIRKQFKQNYSRKKQSNRKNNSKNGMNKKKTRARTRK
jgi:ankyrin repeat protein